MDSRIVNRLCRRMAAAASRRETLRAIAATFAAIGPVASVSAGRAAASVDSAGIPIISCKVPGELCQGNKACCSGRCKQGICTCVRRGRRCWEPAEGALCCSGRCNDGKCK